MLDGTGARVAALLVVQLVAGALLAMHWDDLFGAQRQAPVDPNDPVALCFADEKATIDKMVSEGLFNQDQAARALAGAEARCQAQFGASGPPSPPQ